MRLPPEAPRRAPAGAAAQGFAASLSVLFAFPAVRYLLPTVVAIGLFATPYVPLMPSIVADFFDGQSSTVGLLMSSAARRRARRRRLPVAAAGLRPPAAHDVRGAAGGRRGAHADGLLARPAGLGPSARGARRRRAASAPTPPMPCCSSPCPTSGAGASSASTACRLPAPPRSAASLAGWLAEHIGLTATLAINGGLIALAGLLGRWRLHNHPEALRGILRGLSR